ncbi:unnamed protein product [Gordionus sp. m RMFG-2023]
MSTKCFANQHDLYKTPFTPLQKICYHYILATILALGFAGQAVYASLLLLLRHPDNRLVNLCLPNTFIRNLRRSNTFRNHAKLIRKPFYSFMTLILAWDFLACLNFIFWPVLYYASPIMGVHSKLFMRHITITYWPIEQLCASNVNWLTTILWFDRMISIAYPLKSPSRFVSQNSRVIISIIFLVTLVSSAPYSLPFKLKTITPKLICMNYEKTNTTISYENHFNYRLQAFSPLIGLMAFHKHKTFNQTFITKVVSGNNIYQKGDYQANNALVLVNKTDFLGNEISFNHFDSICLIQTKMSNFTVECILVVLPTGFKYVTTSHYNTWNSIYSKVFSVFMYLIPVIIYIFCNTYMLCKLTPQRKVVPTSTKDNQFSARSYLNNNDLSPVAPKGASYMDHKKTGIEAQPNTTKLNNQISSSKTKIPKSITVQETSLANKLNSSYIKTGNSQVKSIRNITKLMMFLNLEFLVFNLPFVLFIYTFNHAYVEMGTLSLSRYQVLMNTLKYGSHAMRVYVNFLVDKNIKEAIKIIVNQILYQQKIGGTGHIERRGTIYMFIKAVITREPIN